MRPLDINCDLGEGIGNENDLMPMISSCNIACGGHAGDEATMRAVVALAKRHQVAIGAHPSFEDRANFGRKEMNVPAAELRSSLANQIRRLKLIAEESGVRLHHVKPHGALYNMAAKSADISRVVVESIADVDPSLLLYGMASSEMENAARGVLRFVPEAFADRSYKSLTVLTPRKENGIITNTKMIENRLHEFYHGYLLTTTGTYQTKIETVCVHSDTPEAAAILTASLQYLRTHNIPVQAP